MGAVAAVFKLCFQSLECAHPLCGRGAAMRIGMTLHKSALKESNYIRRKGLNIGSIRRRNKVGHIGKKGRLTGGNPLVKRLGSRCRSCGFQLAFHTIGVSATKEKPEDVD